MVLTLSTMPYQKKTDVRRSLFFITPSEERSVRKRTFRPSDGGTKGSYPLFKKTLYPHTYSSLIGVRVY